MAIRRSYSMPESHDVRGDLTPLGPPDGSKQAGEVDYKTPQSVRTQWTQSMMRVMKLICCSGIVVKYKVAGLSQEDDWGMSEAARTSSIVRLKQFFVTQVPTTSFQDSCLGCTHYNQRSSNERSIYVAARLSRANTIGGDCTARARSLQSEHSLKSGDSVDAGNISLSHSGIAGDSYALVRKLEEKLVPSSLIRAKIVDARNLEKQRKALSKLKRLSLALTRQSTSKTRASPLAVRDHVSTSSKGPLPQHAQPGCAQLNAKNFCAIIVGAQYEQVLLNQCYRARLNV
jgi:hypothetical protein